MIQSLLIEALTSRTPLQANMSIPAFTRGKTQLDAIEVEQTRHIANVRIHVERLIGNIRQKYIFVPKCNVTM